MNTSREANRNQHDRLIVVERSDPDEEGQFGLDLSVPSAALEPTTQVTILCTIDNYV